MIVLLAIVADAPTIDTAFCELKPFKGWGGPAVLPDTFMIVDPRDLRTRSFDNP